MLQRPERNGRRGKRWNLQFDQLVFVVVHQRSRCHQLHDSRRSVAERQGTSGVVQRKRVTNLLLGKPNHSSISQQSLHGCHSRVLIQTKRQVTFNLCLSSNEKKVFFLPYTLRCCGTLTICETGARLRFVVRVCNRRAFGLEGTIKYKEVSPLEEATNKTWQAPCLNETVDRRDTADATPQPATPSGRADIDNSATEIKCNEPSDKLAINCFGPNGNRRTNEQGGGNRSEQINLAPAKRPSSEA